MSFRTTQSLPIRIYCLYCLEDICGFSFLLLHLCLHLGESAPHPTHTHTHIIYRTPPSPNSPVNCALKVVSRTSSSPERVNSTLNTAVTYCSRQTKASEIRCLASVSTRDLQMLDPGSRLKQEGNPLRCEMRLYYSSRLRYELIRQSDC